MKAVSFGAVVSFVILILGVPATALGKIVGQGWIEEPNDFIVTMFGLGLVVFFTLFVTVMSVIQSKLTKRKKVKP